MILRETRASGLLCQLSRAWRMFAAGLVLPETHISAVTVQSYTCEKCLIHVYSDPLQVESYIIQ